MNKTPTKSEMEDFRQFIQPFKNRAYTQDTADEIYRRVESIISLALRRRKEEIKEILDSNIVRAEDIMEDVDMIPEAKNDGRLLGIKSVAGSIRDSLKSLSSQDK